MQTTENKIANHLETKITKLNIYCKYRKGRTKCIECTMKTHTTVINNGLKYNTEPQQWKSNDFIKV